MAAPVYGYSKDVDYSKLMQEAAKKGDMARAAIYEAQRNEKIAGEGLTQYQKTNQYASYLPGSSSGSGYKNPYIDDLNAALARIQDTGAYKKQYLQEADRTMRDTLGQYATMTGGIPSTQAVAAASQQADYYKSQLGQQLADLDRQNASLLLSASQNAQNEYQMMISEALDRWTRLGYADDHVAQILGVGIGTPTSDQSYMNWPMGQQEQEAQREQDYRAWQMGQQEQEAQREQNYRAWQMGQQDKSDAYTMAMTLLQAGQMPNAATLAAAGITAEDAQKLYAAYTTPRYTGSGGGGRSSGSSSGSSGKTLSDKLWNDLEKVWSSGDENAFNNAVASLQARGYDVTPFYEYLDSITGTEAAPNGGYSAKRPGVTGRYGHGIYDRVN